MKLAIAIACLTSIYYCRVPKTTVMLKTCIKYRIRNYIKKLSETIAMAVTYAVGPWGSSSGGGDGGNTSCPSCASSFSNSQSSLYFFCLSDS